MSARRSVFATLGAAVILGGCSDSAAPGTVVTVDGASTALRLHSPAKPPNAMYALNDAVSQKLATCGVADTVETIATALPDSVLHIRELSDTSRDWPIMTTVDFAPAVNGVGPDWHDYPDANPGLKFVAPLYDVGMGVMVFSPDIQTPDDLRGKTIAVPRRPSSLRVMVETLLGDGWGVLGDVTLVDMPPNKVVPAVMSGQIDATFWNLMIEGPDGLSPMLPPVAQKGRWLSVDADTLGRINAVSDFQLGLTQTGAGDILSLAQGLAAWDTTPEPLVRAALDCLQPIYTLEDWPGLTRAQTHPGALAYFDSQSR